MDELFGYAYSGGGPELSRLAWQVYEAFARASTLTMGSRANNRERSKRVCFWLASANYAMPNRPLHLTAPGPAHACPSRSVVS